ncbi:hypothetical protein C6341_g22346 [Phytophthora cactorum]|nr:hypothetical protein C6341_g22346 [Phytophthora cactorum]
MTQIQEKFAAIAVPVGAVSFDENTVMEGVVEETKFGRSGGVSTLGETGAKTT